MQQPPVAEDCTARAEWHSLAALLAQVILAHVPSISDQYTQERVVALTCQLLLRDGGIDG